MSSTIPLAVVAIWVANVEARNETLLHGWQAEPHGRGTWSIVWSCLATNFICTWPALHLNVPKHHGQWYLLSRKIGWMSVAAIAPEFILYRSVNNFFGARALSKYFIRRGLHEWTLTHTQFAFADGFWTRTSAGKPSPCDAKKLCQLIENGAIDGPSISKAELMSRGKSDWSVKLIAVLQIIWFVVQTLVRAIQHYQTTVLEIITVVFAFCSVLIYGFSWHQPQGLEYPVVLEERDLKPATDAAISRQVSKETHQAEDESKRHIELNTNETGSKQEYNGLQGVEEGQTKQEAQPASSHKRREMLSHLQNRYVRERAVNNVPPFVFILFACGFGAIHCLGWNSPFPTTKERLAWHICAITTTVMPFFCVTLFYLSKWIEGKYNTITDYNIIISVVVPPSILLHAIGRTTIVVLAFISLRALPADAFQTVNWNNYIPHFAA